MNRLRDASNFVDHCRLLAEQAGGRRAYTWLAGDEEGESLSFSELDAQARKIAAALTDRRLRDTRALLVFSPGLEFVSAFLGCLYAGVVAVPLNAPRNEQALAAMLGIARHAGPSILLMDSTLRETLPERTELLEELEVLITDTLPLEAGQDWSPFEIDPDRLAFIQYTSGSTGSPKGVEVSHDNLFHNERMIRAGFAHDDDTVFVGWLPLFHDMGLVGNVLQPLFLGVHSVLMSPGAFVQRPVRWLRAITRYGGTTSGSPNFGYALCVQRVRDTQLEGLNLESWRVAYNGSEPVRANTLESFIERFAPVGFRREAFYPCYGMAEASLFVTGGIAAEPYRFLDLDAEALGRDQVKPAADGDPAPRRLVSCGRPWLSQRVLIVDPDTLRPSPEDRVGEVWIQGGNVARGYRNYPSDAEDPFRAHLESGEGPFLRTGDLGFLRDEELYVTGRLKDIVIQRGRNYYPQDIELTAGSSHPYLRVDYSAAFTVDDEEGERLVVVQEVHHRHDKPLELEGQEGQDLRRELIGAVRAAVSDTYGLYVWKVVLIKHASIPKTSSGKIQRRKCRTQWERGELKELVPRATDA